MAKLVREYDDTYGGLKFSVLGGVLVGELRLGADRGRIWRADDGRFVFNAAEHSDAQCAFVISENGEFGSSWSGEFNKLFDSIEHLIECASMWAAVGNWCYVSIVSHDPGLVLRAVAGVEIDEPSAGSSSFWWLNNELAVVTEQFLNPSISHWPQVTVLAREEEAVVGLRQRFAESSWMDDGVLAAKLRIRVVPRFTENPADT